MDEKNLDNEEISMKDFYEMMNKMKNDIRSINKNSKKSIMSIESLKEDINKNKEQNFKLKKQLEEKKYNEIKIYKKIIVILDLIDNISKSALELENEELLDSLEIMQKIIRKELTEIDLIEIKSMGELFNPDIHKCLAVEKDNSKEHNEVIEVIEKGYMLKGRVLRPAYVIIAK